MTALHTATGRRVTLALGAGMWLCGALLLVVAAQTVRGRASQPTVPLVMALDPTPLRVGDRVFLAEERGLRYAGQITELDRDSGRTRAALLPEAAARVNASTEAVYWRAPLSAEEVLGALLPGEIQRLAVERIVADWQRHSEDMAATWGPLLQDIGAGFLDTIGEDLDRALDRHEEELWAIASRHGTALSAAWPTIQARLGPILQEHLTPELARLTTEAISDAPKLRVAWLMARGRYVEAYREMLDWLTAYLAEMPAADREALGTAARKVWDEAGRDGVLIDEWSRLGRDLLGDPQLHEVLRSVYRESVTDNPRVARFLRERVVESPEFRRRFFAMLDVLAPTLQDVAALSLFNEHGATRPEVVHVLRSVALQREVAWITLHTPDGQAVPLGVGAVVPGRRGSAR